MRLRPRGLGCLGCLSFSGMVIILFPLILIGALIYWLVNRQKTAATPPYPPPQYTPPPGPMPPPPPPPPPAPGAYAGPVTCYCSHCGKQMTTADKFCPGCGAPISGS